MNLKDLKKPLPPEDIEWRISQSGLKKNGGVWAKAVPYKTSRTDMDRLDEVCGPENWQDEYRPGPNGGVICGISIKVGDEWVTKWDGADNTTFEGVKGGLSDAFKRAGFKWGIGRELYQMDECFVQTSTEARDGWNYQSKSKGGNVPAFYWRVSDNAPRKQDHPTHSANAPAEHQQETETEGRIDYSGMNVPQAIVAAGLAENIPNAVQIANKLQLTAPGMTPEKAVAEAGIYRDWRKSGLDSDAAAEKTILGEKPAN